MVDVAQHHIQMVVPSEVADEAEVDVDDENPSGLLVKGA
jgi:hypothetical protein